MIEFFNNGAFFLKKREAPQKRGVSAAVSNVLLMSALAFAFMFIVSCAKKAAEAGIDLASLSQEELEAGAKKEGRIEYLGMPDDAAGFKTSWDNISAKYGIPHFGDTGLGSAEEVQLFAAEKDSPTKDLGDVGQSYGLIAIKEDVVQPYKVKAWDSIPDWAKDPEGRWTVHYTGTLVFTVNTDKTGGQVPATWKELKDSTFKVTVGDVVSSSSAQVGVLSCAIANGGGLDNARPGIEYFKDLARQGRLDPGSNSFARFAAGEITVLVGRYDYTGLEYRDISRESGGPNIEVTVPQDGAVTSGYALIFNKNAPHPCASVLAIEYMLSDEGQIDRARGHARPIRSDVAIPDDVKANMLDESLYKNTTVITDPAALEEAQEQVSTLWQDEVVPLIK